MAVADVSNSGLAGQKAKALTATVGGVGNANFTNVSTGTLTESGKNYKYVRFTSNSSLVIDKAGIMEVLLVGGGGGGWSDQNPTSKYGGGGGGVYIGSIFIPIGTYSIIIGSGGSSTPESGGYGGVDGYPSYIGTLVSAPGGGGGVKGAPSGNGFGGSNYHGGGAGGAASSGTSGNGVGSNFMGTGIVYYGGGGVGGRGDNISYGSPGLGGTSYRTSGAANTGAGAGAAAATSGGSGVVIVRVQI